MSGKNYSGMREIIRALQSGSRGSRTHDSDVARYLGDVYRANKTQIDAALPELERQSPALYDAFIGLVKLARSLEAGNDSLTGLGNKPSFYRALDYEMQRSKRTSNPFAVSFVDIDHFKDVNDRHGHINGDRVLASFSTVVRKNTKDGFDHRARIGGEEFGIILPHADLETGIKVSERLCEAAGSDKVELTDGGKIGYTISIGVAAYPFDGIDNIEGIVELADQAMYKAKHGGRNRVVSA